MNYTKLFKTMDTFWKVRPEWDDEEVHDFLAAVEYHDIMYASFAVADLLLGPDDGTIDRDDVECQIQKTMALAFMEHMGKTGYTVEHGIAGLRELAAKLRSQAEVQQ